MFKFVIFACTLKLNLAFEYSTYKIRFCKKKMLMGSSVDSDSGVDSADWTGTALSESEAAFVQIKKLAAKNSGESSLLVYLSTYLQIIGHAL